MKDKQTLHDMNELEFIDWVTKQVEGLKQREHNLKKVIFDVKAENKSLKDENKILKANYARLVNQYQR
tara:strand:- start:368 stop:571 length:204 start_codon:yes stop_codon:yes gene_type:complete